jgi:hypothetical protein
MVDSGTPVRAPTPLRSLLESEYGISDPAVAADLHSLLRSVPAGGTPPRSDAGTALSLETDVEVELTIDGIRRIFSVRDPLHRPAKDIQGDAEEFCRAHEIDSSGCAGSLSAAVLDAAREAGAPSGLSAWLRRARSGIERSLAEHENAMMITGSPRSRFRATGPLPLHVLPFFSDFVEFGERYEDRFEDSRFGGTGRIVWSRALVNELLTQARARIDFNHRAYPNAVPDFYEAFRRFPVRGSRLLVAGSEMPWIEAIALAHDAAAVVTSEHQELISESPLIQTVRAGTLADDADALPPERRFDVVCSFSSIEHDGLGRYGEPLDPRGDFAAMDEFRMLLKPGGLLFLGIPVGGEGGVISGNRHRIYGRRRFEALSARGRGWELLDAVQTRPPSAQALASFDLPLPAEAFRSDEAVEVGRSVPVWEGESWKNQPLFVLRRLAGPETPPPGPPNPGPPNP